MLLSFLLGAVAGILVFGLGYGVLAALYIACVSRRLLTFLVLACVGVYALVVLATFRWVASAGFAYGMVSTSCLLALALLAALVRNGFRRRARRSEPAP